MLLIVKPFWCSTPMWIASNGSAPGFLEQGNLTAAVWVDAEDLSSFDQARTLGADSMCVPNVLEHIKDDRQGLAGMASLLPFGAASC